MTIKERVIDISSLESENVFDVRAFQMGINSMAGLSAVYSILYTFITLCTPLMAIRAFLICLCIYAILNQIAAIRSFTHLKISKNKVVFYKEGKSSEYDTNIINVVTLPENDSTEGEKMVYVVDNGKPRCIVVYDLENNLYSLK